MYGGGELDVMTLVVDNLATVCTLGDIVGKRKAWGCADEAQGHDQTDGLLQPIMVYSRRYERPGNS